MKKTYFPASSSTFSGLGTDSKDLTAFYQDCRHTIFYQHLMTEHPIINPRDYDLYYGALKEELKQLLHHSNQMAQSAALKNLAILDVFLDDVVHSEQEVC